MERAYKFITKSIITGIFFLIPIGIIIIIFEKIFNLTKKVQVALHFDLEEITILHAFLNNLIVILFILLLCFLAGLASKLNWGKELVAAIESNVLKHLPGYEYTKATAQDIFGITEHGFQDVVLYRDDEGKYAIAFKVESITVTMIMIFIPSVPKPRDGEMLIVDIDRLTHTELTTHQAFGIMKSIGTGSAGLLSKYFDGGIAKEINELKN
jgi:uncharacterized membrane protein